MGVSAELAALLTKQAVQALEPYLKARRERIARAFDEAIENAPAPARAELAKLSEETRRDLRLQILESLDQEDRDTWAAVLSMRSSEDVGRRLVFATWGLVVATIGMVVTSIVLIVVTVANH
jgi:hypothetical protein